MRANARQIINAGPRSVHKSSEWIQEMSKKNIECLPSRVRLVSRYGRGTSRDSNPDTPAAGTRYAHYRGARQIVDPYGDPLALSRTASPRGIWPLVRIDEGRRTSPEIIGLDQLSDESPGAVLLPQVFEQRAKGTRSSVASWAAGRNVCLRVRIAVPVYAPPPPGAPRAARRYTCSRFGHFPNGLGSIDKEMRSAGTLAFEIQAS